MEIYAGIRYLGRTPYLLRSLRFVNFTLCIKTRLNSRSIMYYVVYMKFSLLENYGLFLLGLD